MPFSFSGLGLKELDIVGSERFKGGLPSNPSSGYPALPLGGAWPFPGTQSVADVEAFNLSGINSRINAIPIYDFDYFVAAGEDSETVMTWRYCVVIVDNQDDPATGSTAYFGWAPIWCDWDSLAGFMREFLTEVCNEPPTSP